MINKRWMLFHVILISSLHAVKDTWTGMKELGKSLENITPIIAPAAVGASKLVGSEAATALANGAVRTAEIAAPALEGASRVIGVEVAKVFVPYVGPAIILVAGSHSFTQLYPIGKEIYRAVRPTEDQRNMQEANTIASRKKLNLLKREEELRTCLMNSGGDAEIGASGRPTSCEKTARLLALFGGKREVDEMTAVFTEYRR